MSPISVCKIVRTRDACSLRVSYCITDEAFWQVLLSLSFICLLAPKLWTLLHFSSRLVISFS